jgi:hypothetical protein
MLGSNMHESVGLDLMARIKNDAQPEDIIKAIRGNCKDMRLDKAVTASLDAVTEHFGAMMIDILDVTLRPTSKLLKSACQMVFSCQPDEAQLWADRIAAAFQYCRSKIQHATTGTRLCDAVKRVGRKIQLLKGQEATLAEKLMQKARKLQRAASSPSKAVPETPAVKVKVQSSQPDVKGKELASPALKLTAEKCYPLVQSTLLAKCSLKPCWLSPMRK